jgi:hypothetical protein
MVISLMLSARQKMQPEPNNKRRGRPPGPPKESKPLAKMGRPSPWTTQTDTDLKVRVPGYVGEAWRYFEFKKIVDKAARDFLNL